jgi:gliding motility-associated-like protein
MQLRERSAFTILLLIMICCIRLKAQQTHCPPNFGFEDGTFNGWQLERGTVTEDGSLAVSPISSQDNYRHRIIDRANGEKDFYGGFPVSSPNGSRFSVQLGNDNTGREAETISVTFSIPANQEEYSIIYYYAVVFQDPGHFDYQQPRFTSKVFDVSANQYIECGTYQFIASSGLPGFQLSQVGERVYYKPWSPVSVNLSGYAGKTMRLEFTNNDCTRGGHFGYAYLDMNENCSQPISGNVSCAGSTSTTLSAPPGFQDYKWFNEDFSQTLGNSASLTLEPIPAPGTVLKLQLIPYPGLGCVDTLTTTLAYSPVPLDLVIRSPLEGCRLPGVDITAPRIREGSSPNLTYSYYNDKGLTDPLLYSDNITTAGKYYVRAVNSVGCATSREVQVIIHPDPDFPVTDPPVVMYPATVNLLRSPAGAGLSFSFWADEKAIRPLNRPDSINKSGTYYIKATNVYGCFTIKPVTVKIDPSPEPVILAPNAFTPDNNGKNDVFRITVNDRVKLHHLRIFNRWGQIVYQSSDITQSWKAERAPAGTYIWVFEGEDIYNKKKLKKSGTLVLIK